MILPRDQRDVRVASFVFLSEKLGSGMWDMNRIRSVRCEAETGETKRRN